MANNPGHRKDPLPVFCFRVQWAFGGDAFFKSVAGLTYETEVVPVKEGGVNDTTFQLPGSTKWANIVLKQGFTSSSKLLHWREEWIKGSGSRQPGTIIQLDTALKERAQWKFHNGWPCKWSMAELDASKSELAIETLEIAHDGLIFSPKG
jgi:phage tail-like protein